MYGPQTRWNRAELNTFHTALFDKRDRILEVVMSVLCAIRREDATRRHRLAVDRFDHAHFIRADLDQRDFAYDSFKRKLDEMQARFQHVGLNTDFAFRGHHSSRRHFCAQVPSFLDCDFSCTDVYEDPVHDYEEDDQKNECCEEHRYHSCDVKILHGLSLSNSTGVIVDG